MIDFSFNFEDRYTFWSGLIGGTFLALSYFGTDQSQVQRYLAGSSIAQSRIGLLMNGIIKVPMQFFILFIGAMVFVFYQFTAPPLFFNPVEENSVKQGPYAEQYQALEMEYEQLQTEKQEKLQNLISAIDQNDESAIDKNRTEVQASKKQDLVLRQKAKDIITANNPKSDGNDTNFIFLSFVLGFLPMGLVGLILAAILSASMSSTSAELNALASTSVIDIYKRMIKKEASERHYLMASKLATVFWGALAIFFGLFANRLGSLIEAVNILGSLFYGTILGIFLIAFYIKRIGSNATFIAAIIAELAVIACYIFTDIPFLWFNVIGCVVLIVLAAFIKPLFNEMQKEKVH